MGYLFSVKIVNSCMLKIMRILTTSTGEEGGRGNKKKTQITEKILLLNLGHRELNK